MVDYIKGNYCDNQFFISHHDPEMIRKAATAFNDGTLLGFFCPLPSDADESACFDDWRGNHWDTKWIDKVDVDEAVENRSFNACFLTFDGPLPFRALTMAKEGLGFEITQYYYYDNEACVAGVWLDECTHERYDLSDYSREQIEKELPKLNDVLGIADAVFGGDED